MKSKHKALEELVCARLRHDGFDKIFRNVEYGPHKKLIGEIDVFAKKGNYIFLFEVKSNGNKKLHYKAIEQLNRAESYLFKDNYKVYKIMAYCPSKRDLMIDYKWIH